MPPAALLAALGLGALLLFSGSKKATAAPAPATKPLDPNMPPSVDAKFKQALATITDPAVLDQLAGAADTAGFANTAAALRARAAQLRGQISIPGVSVPPASPAPVAVPGFPGGIALPSTFPAIPGFPPIPGITAPAAPPAVPGGPFPIPGAPPPPPPPPPLPVPIRTSIPTFLRRLPHRWRRCWPRRDWTDQELATADALANTLETTAFRSRRGSSARRRWRSALRTQVQVFSVRSRQILTTPPGQLPPVPSTPLPGTPPIITMPPAVSPGAAAPAAPLAKTYKVASGDNPSKIAQVFTGNAQNFRQLAAANPTSPHAFSLERSTSEKS